MYSKRKILILFIIASFFIFPQKINAAFSFNISSPSATIITSGSQEIDVSVNITDLPSESYFRVSLQKESGGTYYGYVQNNNSDWSKIQTLSADCTGYFRVIDLNTALLNLKYKIGDDLILDNGNYVLKAHRFTKTCTSYTDGLNTIPFIVSLPTPIPTNSPTQAPTQAPTASPTKSPTPIPTKSPTSKPTSKPTPTEKATEESLILEPQVLSLSTIESSPEPEITENKKSPILAIILITLGVGFLGYGGFLLYNQKYGKNKETN